MSISASSLRVHHRRPPSLLKLACAACLSAPLLSGCATYFKPYVNATPASQSPLESDALPKISGALAAIDQWIKDTSERRSDFNTSQRVLNVVTFGLATGAVVAPMYNAYKDLVTALAVGAGTSFTANALFFGGGEIDVYAAGVVSLACVQQRGGAMIGAMSPQSVAELKQDYLVLATRADACLQADSGRFHASYAAAVDALQRVQGSDPSASIKLYQAGQNVVFAMNAEIDKRAPSPAAVFAAARSLAGLSIGAGTGPSPPAKDAKAIAPPCPEAEKSFLLDKIAYYEQRRRTADAALNGVSELDTACVFNAPQMAALAVNQEAITIVADASFNIGVSGGRPPYEGVWDKDPKASGVVLSQPTPDTFAVQGLPTVKDGTFKLTIRDSSAARASKLVTVTSKAKN